MPFTLSHVAAVVPIHWIDRRLSLSALAIGSMIPDMHYLLGDLDLRPYTHSTWGIFTVSWPAGVFVLWAYHGFFKMPLWSLLPAGHRERLRPAANAFYWGSLPRILGIVCLVLIGALTHKAWDAFTHQGPVTYKLHLDSTVVTIDGQSLAMYSLLQWVTGAIGLLLLLVWYVMWYRRQPQPRITVADQKASLARTCGAILIMTIVYLMVGAMIAQFGVGSYNQGFPTDLAAWRSFGRHMAMACEMVTAVILFLYSTAFWLAHPRV